MHSRPPGIMHPRPSGKHIVIDIYLLILNLALNFFFFFFFCADMFPYEDPKTVSVHLSVPREKKSPWLSQYLSYISN